MAAPSVETVGTGSRFNGSSNSVTITKPASLAEGDLMVAIIGFYDIGSTVTPTTPGSWSVALSNTATGTLGIVGYYKVATASDVAASNFTFSFSANCDYVSGIIYRISGSAEDAEIGNSGGAADTTDSDTPSITISEAPVTADSLILIGLCGRDGSLSGAPTISSYATTPAVTYTERADLGLIDSTTGIYFGSASGEYTGSTTFTNITATISETIDDHVGGIIILNAIENASVTLDALSIGAAVQEPSMTGDANLTLDQLSIGAAVQEPDTTEPTPKWSNKDKSAEGDWSNKDKS